MWSLWGREKTDEGLQCGGTTGGAISGPELTSDPWMSICGDPCLHFNGYLMERKRYSVFAQHRGITQPAQKQYFYWRILLHHCSTCSSLSFHAAKYLLHDIYDITSVYNCNDFWSEACEYNVMWRIWYWTHWHSLEGDRLIGRVNHWWNLALMASNQKHPCT